MSFVKPIARIIPGVMALAVAGEAIKLVPRNIPKEKPLKQSKKLIKGFTKIIIGTALIGPTAGLVNRL